MAAIILGLDDILDEALADRHATRSQLVDLLKRMKILTGTMMTVEDEPDNT